MPREDGLPPPSGSDEPVPARSAVASLVLLEQLTVLANRALEAMRAGDMAAVDALLADREPFLAQLVVSLAQDPPSEAKFSALAQRDIDALELLERGIAKARIHIASELDAVTAAQASVSRYSEDAPLATAPTTIDIRR